MRCDPAADVHADRAQLLFRISVVHPDSRFPSDALGRNSELSCRANHGVLQQAHIPDHVSPDGTQVEDRIANDLARSMISDVPAAAGLIKFHAFLPQDMLAHEQVFSLSVSALGDDVGMFAYKENIFDGLGFSR